MKIILDEHRDLLRKMIGCSIEFGLLPKLSVQSGGCLPDGNFYDTTKNYGSFYSSYLLNLRMRRNDNDRFWITISPGPDSPIKPWSPLWIYSNLGFDNGNVKKDYSFYEESIGSEPKGNETEIASQENDFLKNHHFDFGLNLMSKWLNSEKVTQIELYDCSPYAACIIQHNSGKKWCLYAEYDFEFWINFSEDMITGIRENCKLQEIIK
ncbi:MAG: hypothetical protein N4A45_13220 [Flavobacteriales bacterium]|jgi:hypothetical protein|nr:hypothetical protein [Flavobacteriales bacterium]